MVFTNLINNKTPSFGDPEHIYYVKKWESILEGRRSVPDAFYSVDYDAEIDEPIAYLEFLCVHPGCEHKIKRIEFEEEEYAPEEFSCPRCNCTYELGEEDLFELAEYYYKEPKSRWTK